MAVTKWALDIDAMQEDFFAGTAMIGIVNAMQGYRFCWMINKHFDHNFCRDPELDISLQKKDSRFCFPVYTYEMPNSSHRYVIYKLKNGNEALLPEIRQLDYLWLIQTADPEHDAAAIISELKNLPDIQLARALISGELKNVKNLIM